MTNEPTHVRPAGRRLIAVGVGRGEFGSAALSWALAEARPGDALHVVHAYVPLSLHGSSWPPVLQANDARRADARWIVARAVNAVRSTHPKIEVDGSAVEAAPLAALTDVSQLVDLLVVGGDDTVPAAEPATAFGRALAERSSCPVVIVPAASDAAGVDRSQLPVALLLGGNSLPPHALEFAFEAAARRHVTLVVCESYAPGPSGLPVTDDDISHWETTRQETLDADLALWQARYRAAGVIVELRREGALATAALMHRTTQLIVVARESSAGAPLDPSVRAALHNAACPVAVVPDAAASPRRTAWAVARDGRLVPSAAPGP